MSLKKCATCQYYTPNLMKVGDLGECRRHPPATVFIPDGHGSAGQLTGFPRPTTEMWCGEYATRLAAV